MNAGRGCSLELFGFGDGDAKSAEVVGDLVEESLQVTRQHVQRFDGRQLRKMEDRADLHH